MKLNHDAAVAICGPFGAKLIAIITVHCSTSPVILTYGCKCLMLSLAVSMPGSIVIPRLFEAASAPPSSISTTSAWKQVKKGRK